MDATQPAVMHALCREGSPPGGVPAALCLLQDFHITHRCNLVRSRVDGDDTNCPPHILKHRIIETRHRLRSIITIDSRWAIRILSTSPSHNLAGCACDGQGTCAAEACLAKSAMPNLELLVDRHESDCQATMGLAGSCAYMFRHMANVLAQALHMNICT